MSSFQNFGTWPIYDMIFFCYMICYGWLVHFCCPALSVWPCERSVANRFYFFSVFLLSLPIISASLSNICTVAVVAWNPVHTFSSYTNRDLLLNSVISNNLEWQPRFLWDTESENVCSAYNDIQRLLKVRRNVNSCSYSTVTTALLCIVSEVKRVGRKLLIFVQNKP